MSKCIKCLEILTRNEDTLECTVCTKLIHFYCAGYSEHNYNKMSNNTKTRFTCSNCLAVKQKSPKSKITEIISDKSMENKIEELIKSVSFMSMQFDNFNDKIDNIISEFKIIKIENEKIMSENIRLSEEVLVLKTKLDEIEQHNLGITVDIIGIPKTQNENCLSIVENIGKNTNTELNVLEAYRVYSAVSKNNILVAKLATLDMRKNLIRNIKSLKFTSDKINNNWPKEKVFINERLTKMKRMLFSQTRSAAKEKQYKFVWLSNADILVRKNDDSKIIKIKSSQDIEKL